MPVELMRLLPFTGSLQITKTVGIIWQDVFPNIFHKTLFLPSLRL